MSTDNDSEDFLESSMEDLIPETPPEPKMKSSAAQNAMKSTWRQNPKSSHSDSDSDSESDTLARNPRKVIPESDSDESQDLAKSEDELDQSELVLVRKKEKKNAFLSDSEDEETPKIPSKKNVIESDSEDEQEIERSSNVKKVQEDSESEDLNEEESEEESGDEEDESEDQGSDYFLDEAEDDDEDKDYTPEVSKKRFHKVQTVDSDVESDEDHDENDQEVTPQSDYQTPEIEANGDDSLIITSTVKKKKAFAIQSDSEDEPTNVSESKSKPESNGDGTINIDDSEEEEFFDVPEEVPKPAPKAAPKATPESQFKYIPPSTKEPPKVKEKENISNGSYDEILELTKQLSHMETKISETGRILKQTNDGKNLPDKGAKLQQKMEGLKQQRNEIEEQIAKIQSTPPQPSSSNSNVIINDEQKLDLLHKKARLLSQQYSALGPQNQNAIRGLHLKMQLNDVNKKIIQLEPMVKMRNPRYEPPKAAGPGTPLKQINSQREVITINADGTTSTKSAWERAKEGIYNTWSTFRHDDGLLDQGPAAQRLYGGRMNDARRQEASMVTREAMTRLHKALETMPAETDEEEDPKGLKSKYKLYPHQKQGLAWLIWRETQNPAGGILADDMGLGKTLTLLSLILKQKEIMEANPEAKEEEKEKWLNTKKGNRNSIRSRATLVICPASLIGHWDKEVKSKVKSNTLTTLVYHGTGRDLPAKRLAQYDIVITTYGTVQSEISKVIPEPEGKKSSRLDDLKPIDLDNIDTKDAILLNILWERIILDEAHQIRNPTAKTSKAISRLRAAKRWAVTGTPIQNAEKDMFSLVRFLRCSPFDEYNVWKQWVDKSPMGQQRMNTLVKSMLLRRTKDQKSTVTGKDIVPLPTKEVLVHSMKLTDEERKVYDEVFSFSKQAMMSYMKKHEEKKSDEEMMKKVTESEYKFRPEFVAEQFEKNASKFHQSSDIKAHHLLVLLLRLRQICNHPGLIKTMLEDETKANEGLETNNEDDSDLVNQLANMSIGPGGKRVESDKDELDCKILDPGNPVFKEKMASSKILTVLDELKGLKEKYEKTGVMEKAVVVSQWTSMLNIMKNHVKALGFKVCEINGSIQVKLRGDIVEDFNRQGAGAQIMLLSLAAGGVGLNLVGANHLFLLDMHWNPQLEAQACDRIYRVGQKREVKIHKFLCEDTVESRIQELQTKKMDLANSVLTGAKRAAANKLTLEDLKMLFDLNRK